MASFVTGKLEKHREFPSKYVSARNIDVWLPPGYGDEEDERYPVIYMHDGQNLFNAETSFIGVDWGIDATMTRLIAEKRLRAALVVGIWNTPDRVREYMPERPLQSRRGRQLLSRFTEEQGGPPCSDAYLSFITGELKPFIDGHYRTLPSREHTIVMGSSMGALLSLYGLCEYPKVFSGAGCLSTHWPAVDSVICDYLVSSLPGPGTHMIYFDYGTETLDAPYESCQKEVDAVMRSAGYSAGVNWLTRKFEGAEHSERAWRERVHVPLMFFLGTG